MGWKKVTKEELFKIAKKFGKVYLLDLKTGKFSQVTPPEDVKGEMTAFGRWMMSRDKHAFVEDIDDDIDEDDDEWFSS